VEDLLTVIGLPPAQYSAVRPAQLSGGQVQRVGLARALAANPPVILMDEPFGALDPITRSRIRQEISQLAEWREKTIVLVTHDVTEAFGLADRIALMDQGGIGQIDVPQRLLLHPANDFVRHFFDHQRLQLTWMTQPLVELLPDLTRLPVGPADAPVLEADVNLWELLEKVQSNPSSLVGIRDKEGVGYVHRDALLAAAVRSV
jgi:osmoprotectant transport system ATP-binding protein